MYLLDTKVISELCKPQPDRRVADWVEDHDENRLFLSVITIGELRKGVELLPDPKRKRELRQWFEGGKGIIARFDRKILTLEVATMLRWGSLTARRGPSPPGPGLVAGRHRPPPQLDPGHSRRARLPCSRSGRPQPWR